MLFTFPCTCGKFILVDEATARQFFCPDCGRIHDMPQRAVPAGPAAAPVMAKLADAPVLPAPDSVKSQSAVEVVKATEPSSPYKLAPVAAEAATPEAIRAIPMATFAIQPSLAPPLAIPVATALTASIPTPPPVPHAEVVDDLEGIRLVKRGGRRQVWSRLILGLGFYYGQFLCNLITLTILMLGLNINSLIEEHAQPRIVALLIGITALGFFLIGPTLGIVGSALCFTAPAKVANRHIMFAALALSAAPVLFGLVFAAFFAVGGTIIPAVVTGVFGLMAMYAAWICFMFFVKEIADYLEMHTCIDEASHFVLLSIPLMIAPICLLVLGLMLADVSLGPVIVMLLITVWLVFNSKFMLGVLNLVSSVRQAIRTRERV